ncbi:MAG: ABC1 kinase family protein [Alphaproteobacteria bacterium]
MEEESSLGKRLMRYANVTSTMGGVAMRMAGERYLGLKGFDQSAARELGEALGKLKGPLMKVAQLLATIPEAIPQEYRQELAKLQSQAPSMGWPFVKRRMAAELGADWQKNFAVFEQEAAAAASLGQVHRAYLEDGTKLACKLQYPDMASTIAADLQQLRLIMGIFERYDKSVSTGQIYQEIADRLQEELDYSREARHMAMYRQMLAAEPNIHVANVLPHLSTNRLLTMGWLEGLPLLSFIEERPEIRNQLALNMFRAWYVPFYYYGVIHGDPHPGNYTVREDSGINLLDFGCVRIFPPSFVKGVIDLYHALQSNDMDMAAHAYESWGFRGLSCELMDVLNVWARFIYGPLLEDKERLIGEAKNGVYGRETAEKVHAELKKLGGVTVPREFVFMDRAALGLGSVFIHLKAELNWYRLFHHLIEGFDLAALEERQTSLLQQHGLAVAVIG